jgi:hypothetical protein
MNLTLVGSVEAIFNELPCFGLLFFSGARQKRWGHLQNENRYLLLVYHLIIILAN